MVANYLSRGNCSLNFEKVGDSVAKHVQEFSLVEAPHIADAVLADVFGKSCNPTKALGLGMLRDKLKDQVMKTIAGTGAGDLSDVVVRVESEISQEDVDKALDVEKQRGLSAQTSLAQLAEPAEGSSDSGADADIIKILLWVLLCIITGGLG